MNRLHDAADALARTGAYPLLSIERLFATERVAAALEARRMESRESWRERIERAAETGVASLPPADLRRLVSGIWTERAHARLAAPIVEAAATRGRRSLDRALIAAYLIEYPVDHAAFAPLRAAAAAAADRHAWRWRDAGATWRLWEGPAMLGAALAEAGDPSALLRDAGLVGRLAGGAFVSAACADAVRSAR